MIPRPSHFDLTARGRIRAAPVIWESRRYHVGIASGRHAAVAEPERVGDHDAVARMHAVQREATPAQDRHDLAIARRVSMGRGSPVVPLLVAARAACAAPFGGRSSMKSPKGGPASMLSRNPCTVYGGSFVEIVQAAYVAGLEACAAPDGAGRTGSPSRASRSR